MEPRDESMRDRLPAQHEPDPEKLARYRKDVEVLVEQLRRRKWWKDAARAVLTMLGAVVLFPLAAFFGLAFLYQLAGGTDRTAAWFPAVAAMTCLAGAILLVRWQFRRHDDDLLLEAKRLQAQGLDFEEQMRRGGGG
jgi:hypothetical protein